MLLKDRACVVPRRSLTDSAEYTRKRISKGIQIVFLHQFVHPSPLFEVRFIFLDGVLMFNIASPISQFR